MVKALILSALLSADPASVYYVDRPSYLAIQGDTPASSQVIDLPPGYFIPEPDFEMLNTEVKRLQTAETRLTAENTELRDRDVPVWLLATCVIVGAALGAGATYAVAH